MLKYVLLVVVVVLVVWWIGRARRVPPKPGGGATAGASQREAMLRCRHCGVHLPASESVRDAAGDAFCSAEHRLAHERRDDAA